uniref:Tabersonine 16-O-methyltransferase n=1 Tax=Anthurium amnicola TaxID=1678845 RepID=A0A1D1XDW2_9ARAE
MRLLTHSGFFTMQNAGNGEDTYLLSNHSHYLLRDHPHSISPFLLLELDPLILTPWQSLSAWFRGDSPTAFHHLNGAGLWEFAGQTPKLNDMFNEAMASDSHMTMDAIIKEHRDVFHGLKSLVDVGGGNGAAAMALAEAFPQLKCTVLDLPHVVASAPNRTAIDFMAGNMFEYVPPGRRCFLEVDTA